MSTPAALTRAEWNRNQLNLNWIKDPSRAWNGQLGIEIVQPGHHYTPRFGRYDTDFHGIRAGAKQLITDNQKHGLKTIRALIGDKVFGWAPESDSNDDVAYERTVMGHLAASYPDLTATTPIAFTVAVAPKFLADLWTGFCMQENGRCLYSPDLILSACRDALGLPPA